MINLTALAEARIDTYTSDDQLRVVLAAVDALLEADQTWWCAVLYVGMSSGPLPTVSSYRPGLPDYCQKENHDDKCGWSVVVAVETP